jgi:hypothetical protein
MADRDALLHRIAELEQRLAIAEQSGSHGSGGANSAVSAGAGTLFAERVASALTAIPLTSISERGSGATAADTPLIAKGEATSIDIAAASGKSASVDAAASTALVLVAYCVSGTALTLANKIAISAFPHPNMLLFIQNGVTLLLLWSGMRVWPSTFRTLLTCADIESCPAPQSYSPLYSRSRRVVRVIPHRITRARARRHPTHQHGGLSEMAASGLALCLHARLELVCTQVCLGRHGTAGCARSVHERPCASLNLTLPRNV